MLNTQFGIVQTHLHTNLGIDYRYTVILVPLFLVFT